MENKYIIKFPIKAEKHMKEVISYYPMEDICSCIKVINQLTKCHSCKQRRTYRQFYYNGKVTSVCERCFSSRDPKTINLIYSGKPVQLEERDICDTNVFVITNFYLVVFRAHYGSILIRENGNQISYTCDGATKNMTLTYFDEWKNHLQFKHGN